jgi:hypothetical protein
MDKPEGYLHPSLNDVDEFRESLRALMTEKERNSHFGVQMVQSFFSMWRYMLGTLDVMTRKAWVDEIQTASPHTENFLTGWIERQWNKAFSVVLSPPCLSIEEGVFYLYHASGKLHYTFCLSKKQREYETYLPDGVVEGVFDECDEEVHLLLTYRALPVMAVNQLLNRLKKQQMLPHYCQIMKEKWKKTFELPFQYSQLFTPPMVECFLQYLTFTGLAPLKKTIDYETFEEDQKVYAILPIFFKEKLDGFECACSSACFCTAESTTKPLTIKEGELC